jgi:ferric-dicitrate binding protein FerR (iron transport regulator)
MIRDERNPETILDDAIAGVRNQNVDSNAVEHARQRAWEKIKEAAQASPVTSVRMSSCSDFQALLPEYLAGTLPDGRRLLVEDHTHECVACRRALHALSAPEPRVIAMRARPPATVFLRKYAVAAALLVTAGFAGWQAYEFYGTTPAGGRAVVQSASGSVSRIAGGIVQPVSTGAEIQEGEVLRTAPGAHLMLKLRDGSTVEIGERAEFAVSMKKKDTTISLEQGAVIVQAAKRSEGHLYVSSPDCRVAVTGTVFAVNRGVKGSRVSVVEGSVEVEHGGKDVKLRPGEQVSTHASMASVPIQNEIAWSRNFGEYMAVLNELANLKSKLDAIPLPGLRYSSRLIDLVPADTVIFASVPNVGQALSEASRLFQQQIEFSPALKQWWERGAKGETEKIDAALERVRRLSEYIGDEVVFALPLRAAPKPNTPVVLAEVHKTGLREFLVAELGKLHTEQEKTDYQIVEGAGPIIQQQPNQSLIVLHGNYVIAGHDLAAIQEVMRNIDGAGPKSFASTDFGRRVTGVIRGGTGILVAFDLHRLAPAKLHAANGKGPVTPEALGSDKIRFLVVEQKQAGNDTQRSAELSFEGARSGIASWLAAPAPIGGLSFVSPDAQFVTAAVLKKPDQVVDDLFTIYPDAGRIFEEARKHLGIDVKKDVAASLGGEITVAVDGPVVPTISWKVVADVTDAARLQQTIEKVVNAATLTLQLAGQQGYKLESAPAGSTTFHVIRSLDPSPVPEIHYVYTDGFLVIAPSRALLTKAMQSRQSGLTFARSDEFKRLLPRDGHSNVSGLMYQNAGQWIGALANALGSAEQRAAGDAAAKIGPILVCAYGQQDRLEFANKGSAWDIVMQSVIGPMLAHDSGRKQGTMRELNSYR